MEKNSTLSSDKNLFLKIKTNEEIIAELINVLGGFVSSLSNIKYWTAYFKCGYTIIFAEERTENIIEVTTSEMIDIVIGE